MRQFTTTDNSQCAQQTVSSECPLPCCMTPDNSVLTSPQPRHRSLSSESPLQATTGNTLVQATTDNALQEFSSERPVHATTGSTLVQATTGNALVQATSGSYFEELSSENPLQATTGNALVKATTFSAFEELSVESPLQATTGNTLVQATSGNALEELSLESPLQAITGTALDPLQTVLSENPLPSMHNLSDDSGSEEDPTIESKHRSDTRKSASLQPGNNCGGVPARSRLSAAARISMAVSNSKLQSGPDTGHRDESSQCCYMAPTTKISMAVTSQNSKIGRRLSTMLHNNRLRQQSSSTGKILECFKFFKQFFRSQIATHLLLLCFIFFLLILFWFLCILVLLAPLDIFV